MDVRIDTQRRGIVHPIPRPGDGQESAARGVREPRGDSHPRATPGSGASALDATDRPSEGAWFDANGDGVIESWSFAHGGDSFENFTPPPPRSTGPSGRRSNDGTAPAVGRTPAEPGEPGKGTTAAIHHAHAAYRRDGLSHASAPHSGDVPPPGGNQPKPGTRAPDTK